MEPDVFWRRFRNKRDSRLSFSHSKTIQGKSRKNSPTDQNVIGSKWFSRINNTGRDLFDTEIKDALSYIFQYADSIEMIYKQVTKVKKQLRETFKSNGFEELSLSNK